MKQELTPLETYTILVLFYINILNYMDRYGVAALLYSMQDEMNMQDDMAGLMQTAFVIAFATTAPIFGYLGDRVSRRLIMILCVSLWSCAIFVGSFAHTFGFFFLTRIAVGVGQASFTAIGPTVIYDVTYTKLHKSALTLFYLGVPLGAGSGFAIASAGAYIGGNWRWGLRITPFIGAIGVVLLMFIKDPKRGERELMESGVREVQKRETNYVEDLTELSKNKSFIFSTAGFTCATFVSGAISWWAPTFLQTSFKLIPGEESINPSVVAICIGGIAVFTGCVGVPLGAYISLVLIDDYPNIDPLICTCGLLTASPTISLALFNANKSIKITYFCITAGMLSMNIIWTLVADMLLSVVVPDLRSTAEAVQIAVSHAFGDAGSPYFLGLMSEIIKNRWRRQKTKEEYNKRELYYKFKAMRYAMMSMIFIQCLGAAMFAFTSWYIVADRIYVKRVIARAGRTADTGETSSTSSSTSETASSYD